MIFSHLKKTVVAAGLLCATPFTVNAQNSYWYQQHAPIYYYGTSPNYQPQQHPGYQYYPYPRYGYPPQSQPVPSPAPARPAETPKPKQTVKPAAPEPVDNSRWHSSFDAAWASAYKQGRPLVVLFVHHGCPECDKMDATLANPAAQATLECAVKARIEFSTNADIVTRLGVKFTPTFLVFSPTSKTEVYREVGALSLDRLRLIQPSIESLVTEPPSETSSVKQKDESAEPKNLDQATTRTLASI